MIDPLIVVNPDLTMDLVFRAGRLVTVPTPFARNTQLQRASVCTIQETATIPGDKERGTNWGQFLTKGQTLVDIDNSIKQQMNENTDQTMLGDTIQPVYIPTDTNSIRVILVSPEDINVTS